VKLEDGPGDIHQATLVDAKDPSKEATYTVVRTYGGGVGNNDIKSRIGKSSLHSSLPMEPGDLQVGSLQSPETGTKRMEV